MATQYQESFPETFLLIFTTEILRATPSYRNSILKNRVKKVVYRIPTARPQTITNFQQETPKPRIDFQRVVQEKMTADTKRITTLREKQTPGGDLFAAFAQKSPIAKPIPPVLIIPEARLPPTVQEIKPVPVPGAEIDLRKINVLVQDPLVKIIECNGPNEKLVVMGAMGRKHTPIILSKEEVNDVIDKFSVASKIPTSEGIYKVVFGKLVLSAIISDVIGSKFIIKKMGI